MAQRERLMPLKKEYVTDLRRGQSGLPGPQGEAAARSGGVGGGRRVFAVPSARRQGAGSAFRLGWLECFSGLWGAAEGPAVLWNLDPGRCGAGNAGGRSEVRWVWLWLLSPLVKGVP